MKKTIVAILLVAALCVPVFTQSQPPQFGRSCATMDNLDRLLQRNPRLENRMREIEANIQRIIEEGGLPDGSVYTIPVVVHVIWSNNSQNISNAQVQTQIDILNEDFRRQNSDANQTQSQFLGVAADSEIEFCLATTDPQGNSTNGITNTQTSVSSFGTNDAMKFNSQGGHDAWPSSQYMNMWVCNLGSFLGYAQFPGGPSSTDGVVVDTNAFGNIGTAQSPFHLGRTATHEVGHWLNLYHIWGDGGCGVDDGVTDTPQSDAPNYGCPLGHSSCGSTDMVQNYMDYTDDGCMNIFSQGQKSRMRAILAPGGIRNSILSSPGCNGGGGPNLNANFTANTTSGFSPLTVSFTNTSSGSPTGFAWNFGDGGTSAQQNPSHVYTSTGSYTVSLTVSNGSETNTETKANYISVVPPPGPGINDGSFELQSAGSTPGGSWTAIGTDHVINPAGGTSSDGGMPTDSSNWCEVAADSTDGATPPSNPGGVTTPSSGGAGVSQIFQYASGDSALSFDAAFLLNETANSQYNDWMSVDVSDGSTTYNLYYKDNTSTTSQTSSKYGYTMTSVESVSVDLASLFPSSSSSTAFTLSVLVGNGNDDFQPSKGYIDNVVLGTGGGGGPAIAADFSGNPTSVNVGETVNFTNLSTGNYSTSVWIFGDGSNSTQQSPSHTYTVAGTYTVSLTVSNGSETDTEVKPGYITVSSIPTTNFADGSFELQSAGGAPASPWTAVGTDHVINPAGGTSSDGGLPSDGSNWCEVAADSTDGATPPSNPGGVTTPSSGGAGVTQSFSYSGGNATLEFDAAFLRNETANAAFNDWMSVDISDGSTTYNLYYKDTFSTASQTSSKYGYAMTAMESVSADLSVLFPSSSTSTVFSLSVLVGNGSDNVQPSKGYVDNVDLTGSGGGNPPSADFVANPTTAVVGTAINFTNQSTGTYTTTTWAFGDGQVSAAANPTHTYNQAGTYTVTLVITGPNGSDIESKTDYITITDPPTFTGSMYLTFTTNQQVPGIGTVADEDVVKFNTGTGVWEMFFDGSDMGLGGTDLNAISVFASGAMLFSINSTTYTIPNLIGGPNGGETITENDVVMFLPTSTGTNTAGQMWFIVDGDDIGLDSSAEDITGLWVNIFGMMLITTQGTATPNGIAPTASHDAFAFILQTFGNVTTGGLIYAFDGSDVGLSGSNENLDALDLDHVFRLSFSTTGTYNAQGLSGADEDVSRYLGSFGANTAGTIEILHDLSSYGLTGDVDGVSIIQ